MRFLFLLSLLSLLVGAPLTLPAQAQQVAQQTAQQPAATPLANLDDVGRELDRIERRLNDPRLDEADFDRLRGALERQREAINRLRGAQREEATAAQSLLDSLGPAPAEGQPRESSAVADTRRQLTQRVQRAQDGLKQADLAAARLTALNEKLAAESREQFTRRLVYRGMSPVAPEFWGNALSDLPAAWTEAMLGFKPEALPGRATLIQTLAVGGVVLLLGVPMVAWLRRKRGVHGNVIAPPDEQRNVAAMIEWARRAAAPVAALWAAYAVLNASGVLESGSFAILVSNLGFGLNLALLSTGLASAAFPRRHPAWALLPLPDNACTALRGRVRIFALLALLGAPLAGLLAGPYAGSAGRDLVIGLTTLYFIAFALAVSDRRLWRPVQASPHRLGLVWYAILGICVLAFLALLLGYFTAGRYLATGLLLTLLVIDTYMLLRVGLRDALKLAPPPGSLDAEDGQKPGSETARRLSSTGRFMAGLFIDMALVLALVAALLLAWGMSVATLGAYALQLIYGITIGSVTISLLDVMAAIVILALGVAITRFFSSGLNLRLEGQTQIDVGVRNSIVTGVSYLGYVLSGILAVATLGLDLSNLAIIAGALSVGIGFGLQNIVNNFVSGLILLIERPVKVGDWVVVGGKEGYVRRINVRSTELETFPRASVIIPNSELIASSVMNWTHRDKFGRIDIDIRLAYGSDVDMAEKILLDCVKAHPDILAYPAPMVVFRGFGESALEFAVRGHIPNVERRLSIEGEVRKAIYKACLRHDLSIPYAQTDVHFADLDRIEGLLRELRGKPAPLPQSEVPPAATSSDAPGKDESKS